MTTNEALEPTMSQRLLVTLNGSDKHIYAGTVPPAVVARRRAKNKVARASRRLSRVRAGR